MTYSFVIDVPMPSDLYYAAHRAITEAAGDTDYGMLVHVARATETGFQITEVWRSKEHSDRFDAEVAIPVMIRMSGGQQVPQPPRDEFDAIGLIIGSAGISL